MSDEFQQPDEREGTVFKPLKSTRTEQVNVGGIGDTSSQDKTFEGLNAASVSTHMVSPQDATPLVVVDDDDQLEGDRAKTPGELIGELRSLRSRNQILRTERTSIAGRKYALEVVIETLREKLDEVGELCDRLDAPGELGEALREIKLILGDARRIAKSKAILEADIEAERALLLQERQAWDQKTFEFNQQLAGIKSERDALKGQIGRIERERMALQEQLDDERRSVGEVETQAVEQLEGAMSQIQELEAARDEAVDALEEAVQQAEQITGRADDLELQLSDLRAGEEAAKARADANAAKAKSAEAKRAELEEQQGEIKARLDKLESKTGKQKATIDEQRKALIEMKPILEDWTKLEKENNRLARLVGEARSRGRVNVQELMARAALLKRLERLTAETDDDDDDDD